MQEGKGRECGHLASSVLPTCLFMAPFWLNFILFIDEIFTDFVYLFAESTSREAPCIVPCGIPIIEHSARYRGMLMNK